MLTLRDIGLKYPTNKIVFIFKGQSKKYYHSNVKIKYLDYIKKMLSLIFR